MRRSVEEDSMDMNTVVTVVLGLFFGGVAIVFGGYSMQEKHLLLALLCYVIGAGLVAGSATGVTLLVTGLHARSVLPMMVYVAGAGLLAGLVVVGTLYSLGNRFTARVAPAAQSIKTQTIKRHTFRNETVVVDGKTFDNCTFHNVTLLYHGLGGTTFLNATFSGTTYFFTDHPAAEAALRLEHFLASVKGVDRIIVGERDASGNIRPFRETWRAPSGATPTPPDAKSEPAGPGK
jgi:hypothetical protein